MLRYFIAVTVLWSLIAACNGSSTSDGGADGPQQDGLAVDLPRGDGSPATDLCGEGMVYCGGPFSGCADLKTSIHHCGGCGVDCDIYKGVCNGGVCGCPDCGPDPYRLCSAMPCLCIDVSSSSQHCGACDAPCQQNQQCVGGQCQ